MATFSEMMEVLSRNYDWLLKNHKNGEYTLINKLKTIFQISVISLFNSFTPYFSSYSALADTAVSHNYLTEEALPLCQDTISADGPESK